MKAISAPRIGVDAADRAERGLGPFATLGPPDLPSRPYLPKGAKGGRGAVAQGGEVARERWSTMCSSLTTQRQVGAREAAVIHWATAPSPKSGQPLVVTTHRKPVCNTGHVNRGARARSSGSVAMGCRTIARCEGTLRSRRAERSPVESDVVEGTFQ